MRFFYLSIFCLGILPFQLAQATSLQLLSKEELNKSLSQQVIFEHKDKVVVANSTKNFSKNLYVALLKKITNLKKFGEVKIQTSEFAILEIDSIEKRDELSASLHDINHTCGSLQRLDGSPVLAPNHKQHHKAFHSTKKKVKSIENILTQVQQQNIETSIRTMVSWESRYHSHAVGKLAPVKLKALYEALLPTDRPDVSLELVEHDRSPQNSLVVRITGSEKPDEIIIFGSHLDAINRSTRNNKTPGADDNASGTATNLEIFRVLMDQKIQPKRTLEIHAYAAEEIGLVGSNEIATNYRDENKNVIAMIQFDMNAFSKDGMDRVWFVSNKTNAELTQTLGGLVDQYLGLEWDSKPLYFGSSDHASWHRKGFPVAFPTEDPSNFNRNIHTSRDTLDISQNISQSAAYAKLGLSYILHYAGF